MPTCLANLVLDVREHWQLFACSGRERERLRRLPLRLARVLPLPPGRQPDLSHFQRFDGTDPNRGPAQSPVDLFAEAYSVFRAHREYRLVRVPLAIDLLLEPSGGVRHPVWFMVEPPV